MKTQTLLLQLVNNTNRDGHFYLKQTMKHIFCKPYAFSCSITHDLFSVTIRQRRSLMEVALLCTSLLWLRKSTAAALYRAMCQWSTAPGVDAVYYEYGVELDISVLSEPKHQRMGKSEHNNVGRVILDPEAELSHRMHGRLSTLCANLHRPQEPTAASWSTKNVCAQYVLTFAAGAHGRIRKLV